MTINESVRQKLVDYKSWIAQKIGVRLPWDPFFYTTGERLLTKGSLSYAFKMIRTCINARPTGYPFVRLYDFRHTMACNTIHRWMEQGVDVNSNLYILSTYMGHVRTQDTFWYLSATPEILGLSCSKYEDMFGGGSIES